MAPRAEGGLLGITNDGIVGWARVPTNPAEIVRVILSVDGSPVAAVKADRFDIDVVSRQVGRGIGGFVARLSKAPIGSPPYTIIARSDDGHPLGAPFIVASMKELAPAIDNTLGTLEGMVELLNAGAIVGWIWDRAQPERIVSVDIYDGSLLLGRTLGNLQRDDLHEAGVRNGQCGFRFELPLSMLDMKFHVIRIVASGTELELPNSPLRFGPSQITPLIEEVSRLRQQIVHLSSIVGEFSSSDGKFQREIMHVLADRLDAFAAIQQESVDRRLEELTHYSAKLAAEVGPPKQEPKRRSKQSRTGAVNDGI
jgi:hypothetical protein